MLNHLLGVDLLGSRTPLLSKYSTSCTTGSREAVKVRMSFILPVWEEILSAAWTRKEKAVWFSERLKFKRYLLELLVGISSTLGMSSVMIQNEDSPSSSSFVWNNETGAAVASGIMNPSSSARFNVATATWSGHAKSTTALIGITFWPHGLAPVVKCHCFKCFYLKWVYMQRQT